MPSARRMAQLRGHAQRGNFVRPTFNPPPGLWINGVEYTRYLLVDTPNITNSGYPQTGVFKFRLEG